MPKFKISHSLFLSTSDAFIYLKNDFSVSKKNVRYMQKKTTYRLFSPNPSTSRPVMELPNWKINSAR